MNLHFFVFNHQFSILLNNCVQFIIVFTLLGGIQNMEAQGLFHNDQISVGAESFDEYLPLLEHKKVGVVVNPTSEIRGKHLVDIWLEKEVNITRIFAPEHGFRGTADAGETVKDGVDVTSGLPIISLYGPNKKVPSALFNELDYIIFDIQDVGARFYTYISTLHYVMEAAADNGIPLLVLDRPNPNGHYVDGPVLKQDFSSFVGLHPIPVVHGLTVGELACMINEEGWLRDNLYCEIKVIECKGYDHTTFYKLPVKPSPNLPNMRSIYLYPSLCFFEGTIISVGRGTEHPFQQSGHPTYESGMHSFTPVSTPGARYPKHENKTCKGFSYLAIPMERLQQLNFIDFQPLISFYEFFQDEEFFLANRFIDKLAGTDQLRIQLTEGEDIDAIRSGWKKEIEEYKETRKKYLLYKDFE